jgi:alpha-beta hydrolase superfamily lysophospholipase
VRRTLTVLTVVAAVFVVVLAGAGWYYAGQIGDEALTPHAQAPPHRDLVVASFDGSTVVLRRTRAVQHDAVPTSQVDGLAWPGGRGVLSGPPRKVDGGVARGLTVVSGSRPAPGTRASLDIYVWTDPTAAYGIPYRDVRYPCGGSTCPAWYLPGTATTWWIGVHGRGATREEPLRAGGPAVTAGLPVLDIAYRNDAGAPRDASGRYGYGATEWRDLEGAVGYATAHGAQHVVLFGSSMGGAIVASFLEHSPRAALVTAVVLDAPALDLRTTVEFEAGERTLPVVGAGIPYVLTATAEWIAARRYGLDWNAVGYLPGSWLKVPTLLFHGTDDTTVPIATSDELERAHPDDVQEVRVRGADHVQSWNVDPGGYEAAESAFLGCATGVVSCPAP